LLDEQRALHLLTQLLLGPLHFHLQVLLVLVWALELPAKLGLGVIQSLDRNRELALHRFLVDQLFKDDHLQRALADFRFLRFRKTVVLLRVGEDHIHLAQQVAIGQYRPIHSRYRLVAHLQR
jgi:hypothetical protein